MRVKRVRFKFGRFGVRIPGRAVVARGFFSESCGLIIHKEANTATVTHPLKALDFNRSEDRTGVI
jgi:hypothetical protein